MTQCRVIGIEWPNWEPLNYILFSVYREDIRKLEEENDKLKSEIENMKEVGKENIETLDKMSAELENYSKSFKRYRDFSKQELADSLYDMEEQNKSLKNELMEDMKTETKLNERIRFLEKCLDNKEKVNISLREENKKLKEELWKFIMKS